VKKAFLLSLLVLMFSLVLVPVVTASTAYADHQQTQVVAGDLVAGSVQAIVTDQVAGIEAPAIQVSPNSQINGSPPLGDVLNLSTVTRTYFETTASPKYYLRQLRQTFNNGLIVRDQEVMPLVGDKLAGAEAVAS